MTVLGSQPQPSEPTFAPIASVDRTASSFVWYAPFQPPKTMSLGVDPWVNAVAVCSVAPPLGRLTPTRLNIVGGKDFEFQLPQNFF